VEKPAPSASEVFCLSLSLGVYVLEDGAGTMPGNQGLVFGEAQVAGLALAVLGVSQPSEGAVVAVEPHFEEALWPE
jgi:hypothetical protein